jgi:hypothetical protein
MRSTQHTSSRPRILRLAAGLSLAAYAGASVAILWRLHR